jgi:hypothetical protein
MASALYPQTAKKTRSTISTANANRDGTGTLATILTGGGPTVAGSVSITSTGTTTEGMVRFYSDDNTNKTLIGEVYVPAHTPSATKPTLQLHWKVPDANKNLYANTDTLKASTEKGETFHLETSYHTF